MEAAVPHGRERVGVSPQSTTGSRRLRDMCTPRPSPRADPGQGCADVCARHARPALQGAPIPSRGRLSAGPRRGRLEARLCRFCPAGRGPRLASGLRLPDQDSGILESSRERAAIPDTSSPHCAWRQARHLCPHSDRWRTAPGRAGGRQPGRGQVRSRTRSSWRASQTCSAW
jgi:hypothetical protein